MRLLPIALLSLLATGCGLEGLVFGEVTRGDQVEVPGAAPNILQGYAPGLPNASARFLGPTGVEVAGLTTTTDAQGNFEVEAPGDTDYANLLVTVNKGGGFAWGLVPQVPRQSSVLDPAQIRPLESLQPMMGSLGADTTLAVLLVLAKARLTGGTLVALSPRSTSEAITEILTAGDPAVQVVADMLAALVAVGGPSPALRVAPAAGESFLDPAVLAVGVDYTGDGTLDVDTVAFDDALAAAAATFEFNACYPPDVIRLVLIADFRPGAVDRNCTELDRFLWAKDELGKQMFVTGAIHKDTPRCGDTQPPCLEDATIDEASLVLGNWIPNQIPMYDDGTHGDAEAGDGLWTLQVELPYFEPLGADQPGVRIGYKYTYGFPGQGWTGAEEWPGNKRILELRDLNGDHIVTRQDYFADETTNKDKSNGLSPARGGCGTVVFPADPSPPNCVNDSLEALVDTDGDCELDTWPQPGLSSPVTIDCPEDAR